MRRGADLDRTGDPLVKRAVRDDVRTDERILAANIDPDLVPRPAQKVLVASVAMIAIVAARRGFLAANRLWTKRYIQRTIPTS